MPDRVRERACPAADCLARDLSSRFLARGKLDGKVPDGGAFRVPAIDRKACALCGEICEKPIAAGASDDVDTIQLSLKHSFKIGQGGGVARCEAFKNYACKPRLVAGFIGYWPDAQQRLSVR